VLPKNATDVFSVWESATFFISAFILIAVLWWLHHRTFSSFFVLNMPMVVLNFGVLCGLTLTLYFLEGMVRIAGLGQNPALFFSLFIFSFSVVYALMGAMLLVGILVRRSELHAAELRWGINRLASIAIAVVFGLAAGAYAAVRPHIAWIGLASIVFAIGAGLLRRIVLNRWLDRTLPAG
jgi:uncharacterized membrane protein